MDTLASTASLSFEPTQNTIPSGQTFDVSVNIFTESDPVISTDVWIHYDPGVVQPVLPAKNNGLFAITEAKIVSPGNLYVYALHRDPLTAGPANGTITTLTFKPLKDGQIKLTFECPVAGTAKSQIIKNDETLGNIINCMRTTSHTSTIMVGNSQVLGANDTMGSTLNMWYLTAAVALLTITMVLYIRTKNIAKREIDTHV